MLGMGGAASKYAYEKKFPRGGDALHLDSYSAILWRQEGSLPAPVVPHRQAEKNPFIF